MELTQWEMFHSRPRSTWGGMILYLIGWPTGLEYIVHIAEKAQSSSIFAASLTDFRAGPTIQEAPRAEVAA